MKAIMALRTFTMLAAGILALTAGSSAQQPVPQKTDGKAVVKTDKTDGSADKATRLPAPSAILMEDKTGTFGKPDKSADDDDTILPYYNNYLKEYRLGPSDMISVEVFGQCPDYCKMNITIPPNARISYPLVREGVMVAGKTVEQVAAEITKKLDEFIIDPKVTVTLDKAMGTRYAVMGNVVAPGMRVMDKKVSIYEAVLEAGGVTKNANRDKVFVVSYGKDGRLSRTQVSLNRMEAGKADMVYLSPGDQVFVAGKGFTIEKFFQILTTAASARAFLGIP